MGAQRSGLGANRERALLQRSPLSSMHHSQAPPSSQGPTPEELVGSSVVGVFGQDKSLPFPHDPRIPLIWRDKGGMLSPCSHAAESLACLGRKNRSRAPSFFCQAFLLNSTSLSPPPYLQKTPLNLLSPSQPSPSKMGQRGGPCTNPQGPPPEGDRDGVPEQRSGEPDRALGP